jgi:hypothetical protein
MVSPVTYICDERNNKEVDGKKEVEKLLQINHPNTAAMASKILTDTGFSNCFMAMHQKYNKR